MFSASLVVRCPISAVVGSKNVTELSCPYRKLPYEDAADVDAHNIAENQSIDPKEFQKAYFPDWLIPPHLHPMSQAGPARGLEPLKTIWKYTRDLRNPDAYYEEIPPELLPPPRPMKTTTKLEKQSHKDAEA